MNFEILVLNFSTKLDQNFFVYRKILDDKILHSLDLYIVKVIAKNEKMWKNLLKMAVIFVVLDVDIWVVKKFISEHFYTSEVFKKIISDISLKVEAIFVTTVWDIKNASE